VHPMSSARARTRAKLLEAPLPRSVAEPSPASGATRAADSDATHLHRRARNALERPVRARSSQTDGRKHEPGAPPDQLQLDPFQLDPFHDEPLHDDPFQDEPFQLEPFQEEPFHDEPLHDDPLQDDPFQEEPLHDEPFHDEPFQEEPFHDDPLHDDPFQLEPFQLEPSQVVYSDTVLPRRVGTVGTVCVSSSPGSPTAPSAFSEPCPSTSGLPTGPGNVVPNSWALTSSDVRTLGSACLPR
jgi:hypothetical protein